MRNCDTACQIRRDLLSALSLLTRLPVSLEFAPRANGCWAWPLAGLAVGAASIMVAASAQWCGVPTAPAAVLLLITSALLTGGLHEDGLADTADGLIGGRDRAHRLEIMKDSRIGSYGALALGLLVLLRCFALTALIAAGAWGAVLAIAALSRAPMAALMAFLPNARGTGLALSLGRPSRNSAGLAAALALLIALAATGATALPMCLAALLITLAFGTYAKARIGGQTGDILGASQQLSEAAMLTLASALI